MGQDKQIMLDLELQFTSPEYEALLPEGSVQRWVEAALDWEQLEGAELTLRIVGEEEGQQLNAQFRQKDYATNVLTFDYQHGPQLMADIVICAPVVAREAKDQNKPLLAHYAHLVIHGVLHAQGWDHEEDAEAQEMEQREVEVMQALGFENPYR